VNLDQLGWCAYFERQRPRGASGRVAAAGRERFLVWTEAGEVEAEVSGALRFGPALWPAVGDWVMLRDDAPMIVEVLERRTKLSRKQPGREMREQVLAANVDVLFIVSGLDRDYNPRRIERYLVMARESLARPVILLNKSDLAADLGLNLDKVVAKTHALAGGAAVLPISGLAAGGLSQLSCQVHRGETAALIGSSGVGKSTILNRLLGAERQRTHPVRAGDDRGRHTTTTRELFLMPGGWLLIDMPGLREIQLWGSDVNVDASFGDIQELAAQCRFRDCSHSGESGCAVEAAGLDPGRMENYRKMRRELDYLERKADPELERQTRAKWKVIHKAMRKDGKRG
jgi:ribosome biogenesis GTPase / thiamine phosphate phosphatase